MNRSPVLNYISPPRPRYSTKDYETLASFGFCLSIALAPIAMILCAIALVGMTNSANRNSRSLALTGLCLSSIITIAATFLALALRHPL